MCLVLGGPKLVYAVAKALNLPSLCTIQTKAKRARVLPSLSFPILEVITQNIDALFGPDSGPASFQQQGYVVMVDEVALEERPRYDSKRDSVLGICREHSNLCDLTVSSLAAVQEMQTSLDEKVIHQAKEATVISLAAFSAGNYAPHPIVLSGTCKSEKDREHAKLLSLIPKAWEKAAYGRSHSGSMLWCFATDGDSV